MSSASSKGRNQNRYSFVILSTNMCVKVFDILPGQYL